MAVDDPKTTARRPSAAKQRLIEISDELFYTEGINTVGIDRIIAEAGVTKATFYKQFSSKDSLILEYLLGRDRQIRESLNALSAAQPTPADTVRAVVDGIVLDIHRRGFRGCPFINAAAEYADAAHPVRKAIAAHRDWVTGFFEDHLRAMGHPRPGDAADELYLLRDGAMVAGYAGDPVAATSALTRAAARILTEAHG